MTDQISTQLHKPMPCPKCRVDMPFIKYGEKMGSNGKMAKWPIYEKCQNRECPTGRKNLGIQEEEELPPYEPLPEAKPGVPTKLFQLPAIKNYEHAYYAINGCIKMLTQTMKSEGTKGTLQIFMHGVDLEKLQTFYSDFIYMEGDLYCFPHPVDVDAQPFVVTPKDIKVTKGYRYFTIETHIESKVVEEVLA